MCGRHTRFGPPLRRASKTAGPSARGGGDRPTSEPDMTPRCSNYAHAQCGIPVRRQVSGGARSAKPDAGMERPGGLGGGNRSTAGPVNIFFYPNGRGPNKRRAGTPKDPGPKSFSGPRYARGGLRTTRRSVLPSSFTTSSVVSRVQRRFNRLEKLTSTSVFDVVSRLRS